MEGDQPHAMPLDNCAFNLIKFAIGTRSSIFSYIASDLSRATNLASDMRSYFCSAKYINRSNNGSGIGHGELLRRHNASV
jgi:hypothetical protein